MPSAGGRGCHQCAPHEGRGGMMDSVGDRRKNWVQERGALTEEQYFKHIQGVRRNFYTVQKRII